MALVLVLDDALASVDNNTAAAILASTAFSGSTIVRSSPVVSSGQTGSW